MKSAAHSITVKISGLYKAFAAYHHNAYKWLDWRRHLDFFFDFWVKRNPHSATPGSNNFSGIFLQGISTHFVSSIELDESVDFQNCLDRILIRTRREDTVGWSWGDFDIQYGGCGVRGTTVCHADDEGILRCAVLRWVCPDNDGDAACWEFWRWRNDHLMLSIRGQSSSS